MRQMISNLYINPSFLSFFKIFFRDWKKAARLFFSLSDVIFVTLVKFCFVGFSTPVLCFCWNLLHVLLMLVSIELNSRFMLLTNCILCFYIYTSTWSNLSYSVPFIYVMTIYISNCITMFAYWILGSYWLH